MILFLKWCDSALCRFTLACVRKPKGAFSSFISQFSVENLHTASQNYSRTRTHAHLHMLEYQQLYLQVCRLMFDAGPEAEEAVLDGQTDWITTAAC